MDFFEEWKRHRENVAYIRAFLAEKDFVNDILIHGSQLEEEKAYSVLQSIPLERFIDCIFRVRPKKNFDKSDVPIFSNFERSVIRVPELLAFAPEGLTFSELGYQLMKCTNDVAQKKYGENQSKLAAICSVTEIGMARPRMVKLTSFGKYLVTQPTDEKFQIFKRMLLRNAYLQDLVWKAKQGPISYKETVTCLAPSNQKRRGSNVHYLMDFIFKGSQRENILQNIDWKV